MKLHPLTSSFTRREFLQTTAVAGAVTAVAHVTPGLLWGQEAMVGSVAVPEWASKPMRWAQLTLVEDDPVKCDVGFWLDYFKRTRSQAACLSAGGCVAFYPTEIPFHHRSTFLGNKDTFGELVAGCRKMGMAVIARTDPHGTYDDTAAAHPDWIMVSADGKPRRHWADPEMWVTCAYGPYNFDFMTDVHKEIVSKYKVDGLFMNRWEGSGDCYCVHCTANFKKATGFDLPHTTDATKPDRQAYMKWRREQLIAVLDVWNGAIRKINPTATAIPNNGSGATNPLDDLETSRRSPMLVADRQARHGVAAPWLVGKVAKEYRATMGDKPVIGLVGVGPEETYRWKDSVNTDAEIRIWLLDAMANGMRLWFSKFSGTLHDERWLKPVEDVFVWSANNEAYLVDRRPMAAIGVVYSQQTGWYYGNEHIEARVEDYGLGWYQALVESRIPFEMVHDRMLDQASLEKAGIKTLVLPNIAALSDAQCEQLRAFVKRGGNLVATYETSLYDELGKKRADFGLADVFGVSYTGKSEGPMQNSYIRLEHDSDAKSVMFKGLEDAPRVMNGTLRVVVKPTASFKETPLTLIPSYPDLPMEKVYPRVEKTDVSCLYLREEGGRVAYFPFDIDRTFWEVLSYDHMKLLRNSVMWATNGAVQPVAVEGPGLMDVAAWHNSKAVTVHLVNLTNPMALKGPYRDFFPVGEQRVKIQMPAGMKAKGAKLLVAGKAAKMEGSGSTVTVVVPSVLDHEVVAIEV